MSVKLVEQEVRRFLADEDPEVLCIMGKWGVGKTYAWNQYLKDAVAAKAVKLKRYSYVSLFGQNSLEGLKDAIFQGTVAIDKMGDGPSLDTLSDGIEAAQKNWRKSLWLVSSLSKVNAFLPVITRALFLTVRHQIICIDDLERVGGGLSVKDVMGLVSSLKEQHHCKVVLLLNDEEIKSQGSDDFKTQLEKVSDVEIRFKPTAKEAADIGIDKSTTFHEPFARSVIGLDIDNIRVIRKIQRLLKRLQDLLTNHDERVFDASIPMVTLFGLIVYQPQRAPSIEYLKEYNPYSHLYDKAKQETEEEKKWRALLTAVNFGQFDEFDSILLDAVRNGYFDDEELERMAIVADKKWAAQDQDSSFSAAWNKYHSSFDNNEDEIMDDMFAAVKSGAKAISPGNLDSTIRLFRKLGRDQQAEEMISSYMKDRVDEGRDFFDPQRSVFMNVNDPGLAKAFADKVASYKDSRSPEEILVNIARNSGWNPEDLQTLAAISADEYYELFKKTKGDDLRVVVGQALKFSRYDVSSTNPDMQAISKNAQEAMRRIAKESELNKMRAASWGIDLGEDEVPVG